MSSIYSCTLLTIILLSQLDIFTFVEGANTKGAVPSSTLKDSYGNTLITLNLDDKRSTSQVVFADSPRKGRSLYTCKDKVLIASLVSEGQTVWSAKNEEYVNRVLIYPDENKKPKAKVLYPDDPEVLVSDGEDLYSEAEDYVQSEAESEPEGLTITPEQAAKFKAKAKKAALPGVALPPVPVQKTVTKKVIPAPVAAHPAAEFPGKARLPEQQARRYIPLPPSSAEEQPSEEHVVKRPMARPTPAPRPQAAYPPAQRKRYEVSTEEVSKRPADAARAQRDAQIAQLSKMVEDLTAQHAELNAEIQRRKAAAAGVVDSQAHREEEYEEKKPRLPQRIASVEVVHRTGPKEKAEYLQPHLPAELGETVDTTRSRVPCDRSEEFYKHALVDEEKFGLLSNKVDQLDFKVTMLSQEFKSFSKKFEHFLKNFSLMSTVDVHDKHEAGFEVRERQREEVTEETQQQVVKQEEKKQEVTKQEEKKQEVTKQEQKHEVVDTREVVDTTHIKDVEKLKQELAKRERELKIKEQELKKREQELEVLHPEMANILTTTISTGWQKHSYARKGITFDLEKDQSRSDVCEIKKAGTVLTFEFNKTVKVDELKCNDLKVWSYNYTKSDDEFPLEIRYNKKTSKILVNFRYLLKIYEKNSEENWEEVKETKLKAVSLFVKKSDESTSAYDFKSDNISHIYTYTSKDQYGFKNIKTKKHLNDENSTEEFELWSAQSILEYVTKVELTEYIDDMFNIDMYLLDRTKIRYVKDGKSEWQKIDMNQINLATVNVFRNQDTYSYTINVDMFTGIRIFEARDSFKFNKVVAKTDSSEIEICKTENENEYSKKVEFNGLASKRTVTLFHGLGNTTQKTIFEEEGGTWKKQTQPLTPLLNFESPPTYGSLPAYGSTSTSPTTPTSPTSPTS